MSAEPRLFTYIHNNELESGFKSWLLESRAELAAFLGEPEAKFHDMVFNAAESSFDFSKLTTKENYKGEYVGSLEILAFVDTLSQVRESLAAEYAHKVRNIIDPYYLDEKKLEKDNLIANFFEKSGLNLDVLTPAQSSVFLPAMTRYYQGENIQCFAEKQSDGSYSITNLHLLAQNLGISASITDPRSQYLNMGFGVYDENDNDTSLIPDSFFLRTKVFSEIVDHRFLFKTIERQHDVVVEALDAMKANPYLNNDQAIADLFKGMLLSATQTSVLLEPEAQKAIQRANYLNAMIEAEIQPHLRHQQGVLCKPGEIEHFCLGAYTNFCEKSGYTNRISSFLKGPKKRDDAEIGMGM